MSAASQQIESKYFIAAVENEEKYADLIRLAVKEMPEVSGFEVWGSAEEFLRSGVKPDLLYVDIKLPYMSGVELVKTLNMKNPEIRTVMFSSLSTDTVIFDALKAGASGYIWKSDIADLQTCTRQIMAGGAVITPSIAARVLASMQRAPSEEGNNLTTRERQILESIAGGQSTMECARSFDISPDTVRTHVKSIYKKLNVSDKLGLLRAAQRIGAAS